MSHPPLGISARGVIQRVVDGDTIDIEVRWPLRIRLEDCWAPEVKGESRTEGVKAKEFLSIIAPPETPIVFNVDSADADKLGDLLTFGRVLGQVWIQGRNDSLAEIMVAAGFATKEKPTN